MEDLLNGTPLAVLAMAMFASLLVAREIGRRLGRRGDDGSAEGGYLLSAVLGLLALLIAFTFGLALDRYETRRDLVVKEANAIGTAAFRVRLLDPPYAERLSGLYRLYAQTRLRYGLAEAAAKPPLERASQDLRARIETETLAAVQPIRTTPLGASVVQAVNDSLDVGAEREAAHAARLPTEVLLVLAAYALVSAGVLGATLPRHRGMTMLMFLLLTLALGLIFDLDRPQRGGITVSQKPIARLVAALAATPPPGAAPAPRSPATPALADAGGSSRP